MHDLDHVTVRVMKLSGFCGSSFESLDEVFSEHIFSPDCADISYVGLHFSSNTVFFLFLFCSPCFSILYQLTILIYFFFFSAALCLPFLPCLAFLFCICLLFRFTSSPFFCPFLSWFSCLSFCCIVYYLFAILIHFFFCYFNFFFFFSFRFSFLNFFTNLILFAALLLFSTPI